MDPNDLSRMTFEADQMAKSAQLAAEKETIPGVVRLVMKMTGGAQKRAEYFLFVFIIFGILFSVLTLFNSGKVKVAEKNIYNPNTAAPDYANLY